MKRSTTTSGSQTKNLKCDSCGAMAVIPDWHSEDRACVRCENGRMVLVTPPTAKEQKDIESRRQAEEQGAMALQHIKAGDAGRAGVAAQLAARKAGEIVWTLKELIEIRRKPKTDNPEGWDN
jgi:hypothetical protein